MHKYLQLYFSRNNFFQDFSSYLSFVLEALIPGNALNSLEGCWLKFSFVSSKLSLIPPSSSSCVINIPQVSGGYKLTMYKNKILPKKIWNLGT